MSIGLDEFYSDSETARIAYGCISTGIRIDIDKADAVHLIESLSDYFHLGYTQEATQAELDARAQVTEQPIVAAARSLLADEETVHMELEACPEFYKQHWLDKAKRALEAAQKVTHE